MSVVFENPPAQGTVADERIADFHTGHASPGRLLSPREEQVVKLAALGLPNKIIAHRLSISAWTVNTHLRRMFAKLRVNSKTAMVVRYLEGEHQRMAIRESI